MKMKIKMKMKMLRTDLSNRLIVALRVLDLASPGTRCLVGAPPTT